jgi:hypothetical protein
MELAIHECPSCHAALLEDAERCPICQHELPKFSGARARSGGEAGAITEQICPECGDSMRMGVVRCRNCGSFLNRELEAAFLAKTGMKEVPLVPPERRAFVRRMRDDDFELTPERTAVEFDAIDESHIVPISGADDDFELTTPTVEYEDENDEFELGQGSEMVETSDSGDIDDYEMIPPAVAETPATMLSPISEEIGASVKPDSGAKPAEAKASVAAKTSAAEVATESKTSPAAEAKSGEPSAVAHSIATGGDALLAVALQEQTESEKRRRLGLNKPRRRRLSAEETIMSAGEFMIFCPFGHRIKVLEKHRGKVGRCPSCKAAFIVPTAPLVPAAGSSPDATGAAGDATQPALPTGPIGSHTLAARYPQGQDGLHLHRVVLANLKIKPGSLKDDFETADIGMAAEHLLVVTIFAKGGLLGGLNAAKKIAATRDAVREAIRAGVPLSDLPAPKHRQFSLDDIQKMKVVQPNAPDEDSVFANVPVFGVGRIAVQFSIDQASSERFCLSFSLTEFRIFSTGLSEVYQIPDFGSIRGIPLENSTTTKTCHYTENKLKIIEQPEFYQADSAFKVVLAGWECQNCNLVVSEDSRKKEKIGGSSGSKIAKHPCPKCKRAYGSRPLYSLKD